MVFENGVKNIKAAAYNGARTVVEISVPFLCYESMHVRKLEVQGSRNMDIYKNYSFWLGWS